MITLLLILLLFSNALTVRRDKSILFGRIVMQNIIFVIFISLNNIYIKPLGNGIGIYSGLFHVTSFTQTFIIFIFIISFLILALNSFYPRTLNNDKLEYINFWPRKMSYFMSYMLVYDKNNISNKIGQQFRIIEYPLIIVFIMSGASFLISTGDLISIFLSIELQSYGLYILSTLYRDSESATASGLTYFLLGGLSSCFILLGSGLLYINSGTTSLENIYVITSLSEITTSSNWYQPYYIHLSLIILSVGFLFKITAAPFHFWSPDVYDGIPTIVTTYVAIIPKISIFAFLLELVYYTEHSILDFSWKNILLLSSLLSLFIGAVLGLTQSRLKRLYAYSTINHVGLILLALSISTVESTQSYIFYIWQYTIANLNAFIILVAMGFSLYKYLDTNTDSMDAEQGKKDNHFVDKNNSPIQLISQIRGYFHINPFIAISLSITLFSFAGIPPIIGFFGKQMVLSAALDSGYIFMAIIVILTSVISAAYYLNLIKEMFFFKANYENNDKLNNITNYLAMRSRITWPFAQEYLDENKDFMDSRLVTKNSYITLSGSLASLISILTLWSILFMFTPQESFNFMNILTIIIFKV